jgi:hypothetical protein
MSDQERLFEHLLRAGGQYYCDPCLCEALALPPGQLDEAMVALVDEGAVKRTQGSCATCGETKLVTRWRMSSFAL